jgi:hypothetical protein
VNGLGFGSYAMVGFTIRDARLPSSATKLLCVKDITTPKTNTLTIINQHYVMPKHYIRTTDTLCTPRICQRDKPNPNG